MLSTSSFQISQSAQRIEFARRMPPGLRLVLVLVGLFPLIAPYELLLKPGWTDWLHPFAIFALAVSLGAIAVSGFFIFAGIAGLSERITFDYATKSLTYESQSLVTPLRARRYAFGDIESINVIAQTWSDSPDTHNLQVQIRRGPKIEFGGFAARSEAERYQNTLREMLDLAHILR